MTLIPPVAAAQAGSASGGGFLDSIKSAMSGGTAGAAQQAPDAGPRGDGSVGLFDGVLKKALFGGAAGAAIGFLPFLPGGPVLGGIVGALGGAAIGVFSNWRKQQAIKQENEAMLAAMGVQADDPQVKQILQSGNVSQLIPLMQQQAGAGQGAGTTQQSPGVGQASGAQGAEQAGARIQWMTDPATGQSQLINLDTGQVLQEGTGGSTTQAATQTGAQMPATQSSQALPTPVDPSSKPAQSPVPTQGAIAVGSGATGAINPNAAVNPGVAPALQYASGGGGSAGDAGRPPAPAGVDSSNVAAIAPTQAGIGTSAPQAAAGVETLQVNTTQLSRTQLVELIQKLQQQVDQLEAFLAEQERSEQLDKAAAR